jgi:hypothetical protein
MTDRILKSSISTLEAFSHVRNDASLAHDNPTLNYDESLLIYNHVCSTVQFVRAMEAAALKAEAANLPPMPLTPRRRSDQPRAIGERVVAAPNPT